MDHPTTSPIETNQNETAATAHFDDSPIHVGVQLLRIGPLMVYMRFATLMFGKVLLSSHPNLGDRSERYQRLVKRLILISALLLSMLIWLIETEFMGFFLKYVIVNINLSTLSCHPQSPSLSLPPQKITPQLWIFPPRILTESFVTLKLIALNGIISKYDTLANGTGEDGQLELAPSTLGFFALELSRIEDILVEFFENCELGRSGYLLVNPIRNNTSPLLATFQQFINGRLYKKRNVQVTADDLATLPLLAYRSLNAKRSHSVNCIDDFRKFVAHNNEREGEEEEGWTRRYVGDAGGGGGGGILEEVGGEVEIEF